MEAAINRDLMTVSSLRKNRSKDRGSAEERAVRGKRIPWKHGPRIKESKNRNRA